VNNLKEALGKAVVRGREEFPRKGEVISTKIDYLKPKIDTVEPKIEVTSPKVKRALSKLARLKRNLLNKQKRLARFMGSGKSRKIRQANNQIIRA